LVLDGGLPVWIKEGYAEKKTGTIVEKVILLQISNQLFKTKEQVLENIQTKEALLVDARSTDRFLAEQKSQELD
jgi:thiosulfate/3-mercaptopyruvate sulfurtransferase